MKNAIKKGTHAKPGSSKAKGAEKSAPFFILLKF